MSVAGDRASFSGSFTVVLAEPPDRALTLFDPVGEAAWAPEWEPAFARAADRTSLPAGTVFMTCRHGDRPTVWLLQRYDRSGGRIAYTVFEPDRAVTTIAVAVRGRAVGTSEATIRYDLVAVSPAGDTVVREFGATFAQMQPHWQHALDDAIAHGSHR